MNAGPLVNAPGSVSPSASLPGLRPGLQDPLLLVQELRKTFPAGHEATIRAVDDISFDIARGETLALVGETGCGKTTAARCILRLVEPTSGKVLLEGRDLTTINAADLRALRREMQIVFQDPYSSLDPRMTIQAIVEEPLIIHGERNKQLRRKRVSDILELVGIPPELGHRKPYAFSGGQRQRIAIARALILRPRLVVLDEPVTALDVSIQAQVLNLLTDLQRQLGLTYLFIVHDLAVAEHIASRVAVMYLGTLVELGDRNAVFGSPLHPYTVALLSAIPAPDPTASRRHNRILLTGEVNSVAERENRGCRFQPRCPVGRDRDLCKDQPPPLRDAAAGHWVACHFPGELLLREPAAAGKQSVIPTVAKATTALGNGTAVDASAVAQVGRAGSRRPLPRRRNPKEPYH